MLRSGMSLQLGEIEGSQNTKQPSLDASILNDEPDGEVDNRPDGEPEGADEEPDYLNPDDNVDYPLDLTIL